MAQGAEIWSAWIAGGLALAAAAGGWISARILKREDLTSVNLRSMMDHWDTMADRYQTQIEYKDRQLAQYVLIIEALRHDRGADRMRIDRCERDRVSLYHEINELRRRLHMDPLDVPPTDHDDSRGRRGPNDDLTC